MFVPPPPAINASLGAAAAAELRVTYAGTAALQVTGSCVVEHFWLLNHAEQEGLETRSELKIKNHHQHSEIGGVSLTVCTHVLGHRGARTHTHTHTGFIMCQHFLEVPPPVCSALGISLTLLIFAAIINHRHTQGQKRAKR